MSADDRQRGRKIALVTGGARGIGLGVSTALAEEGYDLAICGTRPLSAVDTIDRIRAAGAGSGVRVEYFQADIGDDAARDGLLPAVEERLGTPNLLVNNAGVAPTERSELLEASVESYDRVMNINLRGPYFLTQAVARAMVSRRSGHAEFGASIIFVTSVSATLASTNRGEYCISKAGLSMAAQLWAVCLAEHAIPVYEVRPGVIASDMTAPVRAKYDRLMEEGLFLQRRWGLPEDVGRAVRMLARGDLGYSTGQVILVDGGMTVGRL